MSWTDYISIFNIKIKHNKLFNVLFTSNYYLKDLTRYSIEVAKKDVKLLN